MGMYTGLRFKGIIKLEFSEVIKTMIEESLDWLQLYKLYPQYSFLKEFGNRWRADFIPRGALAYMPDSWEVIPKNPDGSWNFSMATATDGFERDYDEDTRLWSFQCSLKNYEDDIEEFLFNIVPIIVEKSIHMEYFYEESARSTFYELKDGKVVESKQKGILYGYEDDEHDGFYMWDFSK